MRRLDNSGDGRNGVNPSKPSYEEVVQNAIAKAWTIKPPSRTFQPSPTNAYQAAAIAAEEKAHDDFKMAIANAVLEALDQSGIESAIVADIDFLPIDGDKMVFYASEIKNLNITYEMPAV